MTDQHEERHIAKSRWVFYGFLAFAGILLLTEHRAHLLGILPYLILLACPLMHLFMHHDHGGHAGHDASRGHAHHGHTEPGDKQ